MNTDTHSRLSRRTVLKWFAATSAALAASELQPFMRAINPAPAGYGTDPNLTKLYQPGDFWPLTFNAEERKTVAALSDVIFPSDALGPAASTLRVPDFIDEWISAPYPEQQRDRRVILDGLAWLEAESQRRFRSDFASLTPDRHRELCDDIAWLPDAKPEFRMGAEFFSRFRNLAAGAYYGTPEGWKAIGYIGNTPTPHFAGPPETVLKRLGIEQISA